MKDQAFIIFFTFLLLTSGCLGKQCETPGDCADKNCYTAECKNGDCEYTPQPGCCGNNECEPNETYDNCARDCPNCDDGNECTQDTYDYHKLECVNEIKKPCCGNGQCEKDAETHENCARDCPNCDDDNALTQDSYNYTTQTCKHTPSLTLAKNFKYSYITSQCPDCAKRDAFIYVTEENSETWEGISGVKADDSKKAYLMRWKVNKDDLSVSVTLPLTEDGLTGDAAYLESIREIGRIGEAGNSMLPFYMSLLRDMFGLDLEKLITEHQTTFTAESEQTVVFTTTDPTPYNGYPVYRIDVKVYQGETLTDEGIIIMSAAEPYLVLEIDVGGGMTTSFQDVKPKEFTLNDFSGYTLTLWEPPPDPPKEPKPEKP